MDKINAEVFLTVAETGSFRKAADRLGYTQAGISYIIGAMEESTGLSLFQRERNGVQLSAEGKEIYFHMEQLQRWERKFQQTIDELNGLERGTIRVQIFDSISIHWIPGILRKFREDFPKIKVELITEEDSVRAEQMVINGEVDCGFFLTKVQGKIDSFPLLEENLMAVLPPDHPLAKEEKFPLSELGKWPYIGMKYDSNTGICDIFRRKRVKPNRVFRMDNDYAAMAMIHNGLGFGIFPELLLQDAPYELCCLEFDQPQTRIISIGTANIETCSKACKKFIEYTREWVSGRKAPVL
ncbi:MAG: LysR family transcriptional regulator [Eubacteriales bacterium]|nr:LysR family transcriptional regulator [Eubacteriales bacterium]